MFAHLRIGVLAAVLTVAAATPAAAERPPFPVWLEGLRAEALREGVSAPTLDRALTGVTPIERVVALDRKQPEFTQTLWTYLDKRVSEAVVEKGRAMLDRHRDLLDRVERTYGVQKRFLVAFWGMETHYGGYMGKIPLIGALVTLAYDPRRGGFFRAQLIAALKSMDDGDIPFDATGSWAGAMGHPQFIPTTFRAYAVDGDGDGRRDLWTSLPDVFASAANYLAGSGWDARYTWGREVRLPENFDAELSGLGTRLSLAAWQKLGVRRYDGRDLPKVDIEGSVILPMGLAGPAFMVYGNFRTTMVWNRSVLYAIAVGHLADRLQGKGRLLFPRPAVAAGPAFGDIKALQNRLNALGFDAGTADGIVGAKTRAAIKAFQRQARLPADGYPSFGLLERLGIQVRRPLAGDGQGG